MHQDKVPLSELAMQLTLALAGVPLTDKERERNQAIVEKTMEEVMRDEEVNPQLI